MDGALVGLPSASTRVAAAHLRSGSDAAHQGPEYGCASFIFILISPGTNSSEQKKSPNCATRNRLQAVMNIRNTTLIAIFVIWLASLASPLSAVASAVDEGQGWSPLLTRSERVPFSLHFAAPHSTDAHHESLLRAVLGSESLKHNRNARTRSQGAAHAHSHYSFFPVISSVSADDLQYYVVFSTPIDDTVLKLFDA